MPNTVKDTTKELEDMADMIENKIYKKLGINTPAKEIKCLNNSYDDNIDQRYEPEIEYEDTKTIIAITIYPEDREIWLSLESTDADESYLEMYSTINEVAKLIDKFTNTILYNGDNHSKITKKPYDADSYTEFVKLLIPLMEKTFKFTGVDKFDLNCASYDNNTGDITYYNGTMGDFIYENERCYIDIDYTYDAYTKDCVIQ